MYDTLKLVMQGRSKTDYLPMVKNRTQDIEHHLLHFLENHDEQRIASPEFVGDAKKGMPAMVVLATMTTAPVMIYFGQELGEPGANNAGFGRPSRTSIFDYIGVPHLQRWMNNKKFDGGQSTAEEKQLRDFYRRLLNYTLASDGLRGNYQDIHSHNLSNTENYNDKILSFIRWSSIERLIVVANFDDENSNEFKLKIPIDICKEWGLAPGSYPVTDMLYGSEYELLVNDSIASIDVNLKPLESFILKVE